MKPNPLQENIDRFYWENGSCCAGCDWWRAVNSSVGQCTRNAPVSAVARTAMLRMDSTSFPVGAGHVLTKRDHCCGDFKDEFDWRSLPAAYLARIGWRPVETLPDV